MATERRGKVKEDLVASKAAKEDPLQFIDGWSTFLSCILGACSNARESILKHTFHLADAVLPNVQSEYLDESQSGLE